MPWQPIDTAPKDGTHVLLCFPDWDYQHKPKTPIRVAIEGFWRNETWCDGGLWDVVVLPSHGCDCCATDNQDPTHWMALPNWPEEND